jgi:hypothetical protein
MTQQPNQPARPNPFSSSLPRFGSSGNAQQQPAPAAPQPTPPSRPSPLTSRLGPPRTNWRIMSVGTQLVRFDLTGLGDPFHRLLGKKLSIDLGDPAAVIKALEAGGDDVTEIAERLEAAWKDYDFKGALLLYNWRKDTRSVLTGRVPTPDESESEELYDDDKRATPSVLRALDLWLVLNILARTRANILLPDAPLALEAQYLNRSLFTSDPRLLALALATGCIEESALK